MSAWGTHVRTSTNTNEVTMFKTLFEELKAGKDISVYTEEGEYGYVECDNWRIPALAKTLLKIIEREGENGMIVMPNDFMSTIVFQKSAYSFVQPNNETSSLSHILNRLLKKQVEMICNNEETENRQLENMTLYMFGPCSIEMYSYMSY